MALRQIVQIGEPVLRKKCKHVEKIDEKIIQLLDDMADTMYEASRTCSSSSWNIKKNSCNRCR